MENHKIEYKEMWKDEYLKTVASFANSEGGELIIGINDKGNAVGVNNPKKLMEYLPNKIKNKLFITPSSTMEEQEGKKLIRIKIDATDFPIFYEGRIYIRTGNTTQEITGTELSSFLLHKSGKSWDSILTDAKISDLDEETIKTFINISKQRLPFIESSNLETILNNLDLIKDGKITRAGLLLFGKKPQSYFMSAYVRGGRFKGPTTIIDSKEFYGNLFQQLNDTMDFVKRHINVKFDINVRDLTLQDLSRKDVWEYPLDAIREAIINAIIHRDYNDYSWVEVRIYDDKIWINNPGKLLPPLTIEDLKIPNHQTKPRNPLIAKVFYFAGLIESWGTGTSKIINLCKEAGLPEPVFEDRQAGIGSFTIVFNKDIYTEENLRKMGLNERQIKAVMYAKEKGKITNKEYQEINKCHRNTSTAELKDLVLKGILKESGKKGAGSYYEIA